MILLSADPYRDSKFPPPGVPANRIEFYPDLPRVSEDDLSAVQDFGNAPFGDGFTISRVDLANNGGQGSFEAALKSESVERGPVRARCTITGRRVSRNPLLY